MSFEIELCNQHRKTKGLKELEPLDFEIERVGLAHDDIIQETFKGLKPCPFCGGKNVYIDMCGSFLIHHGDGRCERLICWDCGIGQSPTPKEHPEIMIMEWNTRAYE